MSFKEQLRKIVLYTALGWGSICGVTMDPNEIDELMANMHRVQIVHTIEDEDDTDMR